MSARIVETSDPPRRSGAARLAYRHRVALSALGHFLLFAFALFAAFGLYYNFKPSRFYKWIEPFFLHLLPICVLIKVGVFAKMRLFQRGWRYFGMRDLLLVIKATWISSALLVLVTFYVVQPAFAYFGENFFEQDVYSVAAGDFEKSQFPQSVFLLDWGMTIAVVCGSRVLVRLYHEETRPVVSGGPRRCLIVGAGDTGEALLRQILRMPVERYRVAGFLDDDPGRRSVRIHDVPVVGTFDEARALCEQYEINELLIAQPGMPQRVLRRMVEQCAGANVRFQIIPGMEDVIAGRVTVSQIRDVDIKDLLGREQVELDEAGIREYLQGRRVVVTGAGGSIGSEICRQLARFSPGRLILIEHAENNLFEIDRELGRVAADVPRVCYIADICDADRIARVFDAVKPDVVFHAAAHKHVPMMELNVGESVKNNVVGTRTVADAAKRVGCQRFVMISTDKAVNPTSVMGATKRVAEMYIQQLRQGADTQYMTVRFGNVLGSSGSVVPIFQQQIAAGGPVTVTDPAMTRYFMTIPEAAQLVLQAGVMGADGDIFVLDMGEPVKIMDLAREMITLSGLRPGEDIEIAFSGIRPGEKLFEELSVRGEDMSPTKHEKIYIWRNRPEDWPRLCRQIDELVASADRLPADELRRRLAEIVPEYDPSPAGPGTAAPSPDPSTQLPRDATAAVSAAEP